MKSCSLYIELSPLRIFVEGTCTFLNKHQSKEIEETSLDVKFFCWILRVVGVIQKLRTPTKRVVPTKPREGKGNKQETESWRPDRHFDDKSMVRVQ